MHKNVQERPRERERRSKRKKNAMKKLSRKSKG